MSAEELVEILEVEAGAIARYLRSGRKVADWKYLSVQSLVLALGQTFGPDDVLPAPPFRGEVGACYRNCFEQMGGRYVYVEGFGKPSGLPLAFPHAWLWDLDGGKVVEPTWRHPPEDLAYVGIPFDPEFVMAVAEETGVYGIFENDFSLGHRLKREGVPDGAIAEI